MDSVAAVTERFSALSALPDANELACAQQIVRSRMRAKMRPPEFSESSLNDLARQLDRMVYLPKPYRLVQLKKKDGGTRPICLPSYRDKLVARAMLDRLSPRLELHFSSQSFAYRSGLGVADALKHVRTWRSQGLRWALQLDICNCFASISPWQALSRLSKYGASTAEIEIVRRLLLNLVIGPGGSQRPKGLPQGLSISPILAEAALTSLDRHLTLHGLSHARYGDDILIGIDSVKAAPQAQTPVETWLKSRGLQLSNQKRRLRRICRAESWLGRGLLPARATRPAQFLII